MPTAATTLALTWLAAAAAGTGEVRLHWRQDEHALDALPADLPAAAAAALEQWAAWAAEREYGLYLDDPGRVLYIAEEGDKALALIGRTTEFFDARLPAPVREPAEGGGATRTEGPWEGPAEQPAPAEDVIPDDPESAAPAAPRAPTTSATPAWQSSWGAGSDALDRDTIVLLELDPDGYAAALGHLVDLRPSLGVWATSARASVGFVLESPLTGAWLHGKGGEGGEEFSPEAELVHRLTDLLLLRRFGRQPYWIAKGVCWQAEMKVRGGIYCYPFRDEFVYVVEHEGWPIEVRNLVKKDFKKEALTIGHLSALRRGHWSGQAARLAFGGMAWLLENRAVDLPAVLEQLRLTYELESRIDKGGGLWERDVSYEVPDDAVQQAFEEHLGPKIWAELTEGLKNLR